jgi:hypothetical protein
MVNPDADSCITGKGMVALLMLLWNSSSSVSGQQTWVLSLFASIPALPPAIHPKEWSRLLAATTNLADQSVR